MTAQREVVMGRTQPLFDRLETPAPRGPSAAGAGAEAPAGSLAQALLEPLETALSRGVDAMVADTARLRLLACAAALLRARWETAELPPSLTSLTLGELAEDPYTGEAFR